MPYEQLSVIINEEMQRIIDKAVRLQNEQKAYESHENTYLEIDNELDEVLQEIGFYLVETIKECPF